MKITLSKIKQIIREELEVLREQRNTRGTNDYLSVAAPSVQLSPADQKRMVRSSIAQLHDQLESGECNPSDKSGQCKADQAQLAALKDKEQELAGA